MGNLEDESVRVTQGVLIEFSYTKRGDKIIGRGLWLIQGSSEDPTEFYIPDFEIDLHIKALEKAKALCEKDKIYA